ncbi:uncharacterized protein METZ01_LOCUS425351 [marine metagenome]|uniref:Uncharacterized protein n=1 Tax=marine metagenome TaxID=408172 RepID=A0A382XMX0_9ZZZZ
MLRNAGFFFDGYRYNLLASNFDDLGLKHVADGQILSTQNLWGDLRSLRLSPY